MTTKSQAKARLIAAFAVGVSALVISAKLPPGEFKLIVHEIGLAVLIVFLATLTIESVRVKQFSDELKAHVDESLDRIAVTATDAILKGPLPQHYYDHIKRLMILNQTFRRNWRIALTFVEDGTQLKIWYEVSYTVENLSGASRPYDVEISEKLDGLNKDAEIRYLRGRFEHATEAEFESKQTPEKPLGHRDGGRLLATQSVQMPNRSALNVEGATVSWARRHDMFHIGVVDPADGILCEVDHPESLAVLFEFPEGPNHSASYAATKIDEKREDGRKRSIWQYPFPMVPSVAIICRWTMPSSVETAPDTTDA